jgi:very-short-patch-repair endonuclease
MRPRTNNRSPDDAGLARLAARQHGVVSRDQLGDLGFTKAKIQTLVARDRLPRVHRCVYAVGHAPLGARGRWMAAVLACGPGAALSHGDAAALHDIRHVGGGAVHVTATKRHDLEGVRCHWARILHPIDCARVDGIPVTTLARTYLDLAEILNHGRLIDALEAAQRQNKLDVSALHAVIARNPGRHATHPLREAIAELDDQPPLIQSPAEQAFRELVRNYGLPQPQFNVYVEGELVDAVWWEQRLVAEVDGWNFHRSKRSFANDRRRDRKLVKAKFRAVRYTGDEVLGEPEAVAGELSELLRDGPWLPPARSGP